MRADDTKSLKERLGDRIKDLEREIDQMRNDEQNERYALLNKHIEQQA